MRMIFAAVAVAIAFSFAGSAGATEGAFSPAVTAPTAKATIVAQRCRCVERRWNGSCKLRVCRDHW